MPLYHFVVVPIMVANFIIQLKQYFASETFYQGWLVIVAIGLVLLTLSARIMALRAQDRVIRLEERLRLARILGPNEQPTIDKLAARQLIALRFASDEEIPALVARCISGEITSSADIKKDIKNWRPDYFRV